LIPGFEFYSGPFEPHLLTAIRDAVGILRWNDPILQPMRPGFFRSTTYLLANSGKVPLQNGTNNSGFSSIFVDMSSLTDNAHEGKVTSIVSDTPNVK